MPAVNSAKANTNTIFVAIEYALALSPLALGSKSLNVLGAEIVVVVMGRQSNR